MIQERSSLHKKNNEYSRIKRASLDLVSVECGTAHRSAVTQNVVMFCLRKWCNTKRCGVRYCVCYGVDI